MFINEAIFKVELDCLAVSYPQLVFPHSLSWVSPITNSFVSLCSPIPNLGFPNPQPHTFLCVTSITNICIPNIGSPSPQSHKKIISNRHIEFCNWLAVCHLRYLRVNSEGKSPGSFMFPRVLFIPVVPTFGR